MERIKFIVQNSNRCYNGYARTLFGVPRNLTKNIGVYDMGKNKIITNKHNGGNKYILKKEPKVL